MVYFCFRPNEGYKKTASLSETFTIEFLDDKIALKTNDNTYISVTPANNIYLIQKDKPSQYELFDDSGKFKELLPHDKTPQIVKVIPSNIIEIEKKIIQNTKNILSLKQKILGNLKLMITTQRRLLNDINITENESILDRLVKQNSENNKKSAEIKKEEITLEKQKSGNIEQSLLNTKRNLDLEKNKLNKNISNLDKEIVSQTNIYTKLKLQIDQEKESEKQICYPNDPFRGRTFAKFVSVRMVTNQLKVKIFNMYGRNCGGNILQLQVVNVLVFRK